MISHEGYARAIRGRGHIFRRKRSRMTLPGQFYATREPDPGVPLELSRLDVYQETPPDNIALPLETTAESLWVRRTTYLAVDDRQPIQIQVSWLPDLPDQAETVIRSVDPEAFWPEAVQEIIGRRIATVRQLSRTRRANPFEADAFGIPDSTKVFVADLTTYDPAQRPIEHSRYTWPVDAVRVSECYPYPGGSAGR